MSEYSIMADMFKGKKVKIMYQQINSGTEKTGIILDTVGNFIHFELLNGKQYFINMDRIVTIEEV